jgi:hypothetical protein
MVEVAVVDKDKQVQNQHAAKSTESRVVGV